MNGYSNGTLPDRQEQAEASLDDALARLELALREAQFALEQRRSKEDEGDDRRGT